MPADTDALANIVGSLIKTLVTNGTLLKEEAEQILAEAKGKLKLEPEHTMNAATSTMIDGLIDDLANL